MSYVMGGGVMRLARILLGVGLAGLWLVVGSGARGDPGAFDLSPDGRFIYVSNEEAHIASLIDIASRKVVATVKVGVEPEGVAVSPDGKWVYVSRETSHTISVVDAASAEVAATPPV